MADISWQDVLEHIRRNNPHSDCRDALRSILHPKYFAWREEIIQPGDPRIDTRKLRPISSRDVNRYIKKYRQGSDFPAVVFTLNSLDEGGRFDYQDGAHRLQAALNLNAPLKAFIGVWRSTS